MKKIKYCIGCNIQIDYRSEKCLHWRLEKYTKEDLAWALKQANKFLLEWDKQNNIPCERGQWE